MKEDRMLYGDRLHPDFIRYVDIHIISRAKYFKRHECLEYFYFNNLKCFKVFFLQNI